MENAPANRDKAGRFVKGVSGNPSGRRKWNKPAKLQEYADQAPEKLRAIADDPSTPVKVRAEIERWFYEVIYGKPSQAIDMDARMETEAVTTVRFEGKLEEWSR